MDRSVDLVPNDSGRIQVYFYVTKCWPKRASYESLFDHRKIGNLRQ